MQALTIEDLLPLEEFAARRRELFCAQLRYRDRYRRVRIGPALTLVFENRQTLWFRVQEVLHVARLSDPARVSQELALYNCLLPGKGRLQAALLIAIDELKMSDEMARWQQLRGDQLTLYVGERAYHANLLTCRPEDRCIGAAHWVQFVLDAEGREALGDARLGCRLMATLPDYVHDSGPLGDEIRLSLRDDLGMSDRAA